MGTEYKCRFCDCAVEVNDDLEITFCYGCELGVGSNPIIVEVCEEVQL